MRPLLWLLIVGLTIIPRPALADDARPPVPAGARLSLEFDKKQHFLGENVLLHLVIENVGREPFSIEMGGDYRGAPRALRFTVLAFDAKGKEVPDPDPNPMCMGGLGYTKEIKPGEKHYESLMLMRYRHFDAGGTYRLRVSHDFGWAAADETKRPTAEATIELVMPNEEQARQVVDEAYSLPKDHGGSAGERRKPFADFQTMMYPVYLPLLFPKAQEGDEGALSAIGAMPTPEATKKLIELTANKDQAFGRKALQTLNARLPDPQLENKIGGRNPFENDFQHRRRVLVKESWRDAFAPALREIAHRLLDERDAESLKRGAYVLECLGKQEDLSVLRRALDQETARVKELPREEGIYPRPRGACQELDRAVRLMVERGVKVNEDPKTAGELILFAVAIHAREDFRPKGWEDALGRALGHDLPFVREKALENLPAMPSQALRDRLPRLLADGDVDVRIAACHVAEQLKAPELRQPVLEALKTANEHWLLNAANNAASALGAEKERIRILASRLDDEPIAAECLSSLISTVIADTNGYGHPSKIDAVTGGACKKAWEGFLDRHGEALAAGKKFKLSDPAMPLKELFPGCTFYPRKTEP
jgi:hypothetical protein